MADDVYRTVRDGQEGKVEAIDELCPSAGASDQSTAYREFYAPRNIRYGITGYFLRTTAGASMIVVTREKQDGPFGEPEFVIFRPLMTHLRRAVLLQRELFLLQTKVATFAVYLDRHPSPFLLTDAHGRVLYANAAQARSRTVLPSRQAGSS